MWEGVGEGGGIADRVWRRRERARVLWGRMRRPLVCLALLLLSVAAARGEPEPEPEGPAAHPEPSHPEPEPEPEGHDHDHDHDHAGHAHAEPEVGSPPLLLPVASQFGSSSAPPGRRGGQWGGVVDGPRRCLRIHPASYLLSRHLWKLTLLPAAKFLGLPS